METTPLWEFEVEEVRMPDEQPATDLINRRYKKGWELHSHTVYNMQGFCWFCGVFKRPTNPQE